jgi:hypothetical protein
MNCKPGDLAVVIGCTFTPEIVGRIVECVRLVTPGEILSANGLRLDPRATGPTWLVRATRALPNRTSGGHLQWLPERFLADRKLRPITGLPITDDVTDEVTI